MTNSLEPASSFAGDPAPRTSWRWRLEDRTGSEVDVAAVAAVADVPGFPSQSDAESWLGEVWRDLVEDGVDQVTLFEAGREVYGPMSLHTQA